MKTWSPLFSALCLLLLAAGPRLQGGAIPVVPQGGPKPAPAGPTRRASLAPVRGIHGYLCGLHFYNGQMERQVVAHHFCAHQGEDLMQCVIYDSNRKNARLIGIEYIISARRFRALPPEEQRLWHSHAYEVKSGLLMAPLLTDAAEKVVMKDFATTYGKTWHTWQVDRGDPLPLGIPQLMMGFTADGQVDPKVLAAQDQDLGLSTAAKKRQRADLPDPIVDPAADAWRNGKPMQLDLRVQGPPETVPIPIH
jgi:hypothetical protein